MSEDNGHSPADIITYFGVPLAVLGVLPTLYTALRSIFTLRRVRKILQSNHVTAITRSSLLSGIIEVEIPRQSIHPLDRNEEAYFHFSDGISHLRGGTWTQLNWKELQIGTKSYRLQYHDELVQPAAEVQFEALVAFLLDRGAIPSASGFADLRAAGLWTPTGTRLLLSPRGREAVLSIGAGADGDGILSLVLQWRKEWDLRGIRDLPPYWTRIHRPENHDEGVAETKAINDEKAKVQTVDEIAEAQGSEQIEGKDSEKQISKRVGTDEQTLIDVDTDIKKARRDSVDNDSVNSGACISLTEKYIPNAGSIRLRLGPTGVEEAHCETSSRERISIRHLRASRAEPSAAATWFCSAATALRAHEGGLWAYSIPSDILALSRKEIVPCGVMCLLQLIPEDQVPTWRTPSTHDRKLEEFEEHQKMHNRLRAQAEEMRLPPAQAQAARISRINREMSDMLAETQRRQMREEKAREMEVIEALSSQRLGATLVAEANRKWLVEQGHVSADMSLVNIVEGLLFEMLRSEEKTRSVVDMLEAWRQWAEGGGMTRIQYDMVRDHRLEFAHAALFLEVIRESSSATASTLVADMQECLRLWRTVRLG